MQGQVVREQERGTGAEEWNASLRYVYWAFAQAKSIVVSDKFMDVKLKCLKYCHLFSEIW